MRGPATFLKKYRPEMLLTLAFAAVCFIYDLQLKSHLDIDSHRYLELGQRLLDSGRFEHEGVHGNLTPDYSRTPTYPLLVAGALGIFSEISAAAAALVWLQRGAWAASVALLLPRIRRSNGLVRRWTLIGKIVLLFSPVVIVHGALVLTDLLYAAGLLVSIQLMRSSWRRGTVAAAVAGIFNGILTLLRPVHLLVPVVAALPFVRRRMSVAVIMVTVSLLLPAAWIARNYSVHGKLSISALDGRALALHQEQSLRRMDSGDSHVPMGPEFIAALHSTEENPITASWILMRDFRISEIEADSIAKSVAIEAIIQRPGLYLKQSFQNLGRLFWSRIDGYNLAVNVAPAAGERLWRFAGTLNGVWGIVFFVGVPLWLLLARVPRRMLRSPACISMALIALYLIIVPALTTVTYGRFVLPLLPFIGLVYSLGDVRGRRNSSRLWQEKSEKKNFPES